MEIKKKKNSIVRKLGRAHTHTRVHTETHRVCKQGSAEGALPVEPVVRVAGIRERVIAAEVVAGVGVLERTKRVHAWKQQHQGRKSKGEKAERSIAHLLQPVSDIGMYQLGVI